MSNAGSSTTGSILLGQIGFGVIVVGIWALIDWLEWMSPSVSKSPLEVFGALVSMFEDGSIQQHTIVTMQAVVVALAAAAVVGIATGLVLALLPRLEAIVTPYIDAFNSMPRIALAPVFILMFGIGQMSKIVLAFTLVVFIIMIAARAGVHAVDPDVRRLVRTMAATKTQIFFLLLLPSAIPSIFAGLRLGLIYSLLGVVASELIAARAGLGQLISLYSGRFQLDRVYAILLILMAIGVGLNVMMKQVEKRLLNWRSVDEN